MQTVKISALVFGFALVTAACGDSKSSLLPTGPSALSAEGAQASTADGEYGTTANGPKPGNGNGNPNGNGNGKGNGNGNGNDNRTPTNTSPTSPVPPGKSKVEIEGLISAASDSSITVNSQVVGVTAATVIRHGNRPIEKLYEGDRVHVRANRVAAAGGTFASFVGATLEATEIRLQRRGDAPDAAPLPEPETLPDPEPEPEPAAIDALVSVSAVDASAAESGANTGVFRLTRVSDLTMMSSPLTVTYTLSGTATMGVDYQNVPMSVTFDAGEPTVDVTVTPSFDTAAEGVESVTLTLMGVAPYEFGSPAAASVNISDAEGPFVTVVTSDAEANEWGNFGMFTLTRTGSTSEPLTVTVMFSGTTTSADYQLFTLDYQVVTATVTFAANSATTSVMVFPRSDTVADSPETLIITVLDGATYDPGVTASATLTITGS
jgi:hypothetical protein